MPSIFFLVSNSSWVITPESARFFRIRSLSSLLMSREGAGEGAGAGAGSQFWLGAGA